MNILDLIQQNIKDEKVEWKMLGEVAEFKRGQSITKKDINENGTVPVIAGGQKPAYYHDKFNREGETIAVAGSGAYAGFVSYFDYPIFLSDAFSVNIDKEILNARYVFHFLKMNQEKIHKMKSGGGVPHVYGKDLAKLPIPIPFGK